VVPRKRGGLVSAKRTREYPLIICVVPMDITYNFLKVLGMMLLKTCEASNGNDHSYADLEYSQMYAFSKEVLIKA
jgi:hypothetical protein